MAEDSDFPSSDEEGDPFWPRLPYGVRKEIVDESVSDNADRPHIGDEVFVHVVMQLVNGTKIWSTRDGEGAVFNFILGLRPLAVIEGIELGVLTMKKGEVSSFSISSRFAFGTSENHKRPSCVPPGARVIVEIELVSWRAGPSVEVDLFQNGCAVKSTVERGSGKFNPKRGQEVVASVKAVGRDGQLIEEYEDVEHTVGSAKFGLLSTIVAEALTRMVETERATVALRRYSLEDKIVDRTFAGATVEISLTHIYESSDVSPQHDGSLLKKVLTRGHGTERPDDTSTAKVLFASATNGSTEIPGFPGPHEVEFRLGDGIVCDALEFVVLDMLVGERAELTCTKPSIHCQEPRLGLPNKNVQKAVFTIELISLLKTPDAAGATVEERVSQAASAKERGSDLFKRQRYSLALARYEKALTLIAAMETNGAVQDLKKACDLNKAACFLKLGDPSRAIVACDSVLQMDPGQIKALYRRASAYYELSDYSCAARDLEALLKQDAKNVDARKLLAQVRESKKLYRVQAKSTAARMIARQEGSVDAQATAVLAEEATRLYKNKGPIFGVCSCFPFQCLGFA